MSFVEFDSGMGDGILYLAQYVYHPDRNLLSQTDLYREGDWVNLLQATRGYEPRRDLLTNLESRVGASLISQFDYVNDALGRRTLRVDNATTTNLFSYNSRSELTNAVMPALSGVEGGPGEFSWLFDSIGNRQTYTTNGTTFTYTANNLNQYTEIMNGGLRDLSYDLDGNLTNDGQWAYTWDGENRLIGASNESTVASYAYDYMSRRTSKTVEHWDGASWVGQSTNLFVYDGWNLICEVRSTLAASPSTNFYVWGQDLSGTLQGAGGVGGLLCVIRNGAPYFPCYDANGNISDYVDTNGTVVAHREYDAFGNTIVATGPMVNDFNFWFSTKYLDQETGLYYYGYRYYDPVTGRWLSRDPIGEPSFELATKRQKSQSEIEREIEAELYVLLSRVDPTLAAQLGLRPGLPRLLLYPFVGNNPLNEFDPLGLSCFTECWKKCIDDNYGKSFAVALGLSYFSWKQIIQDIYNGAVEVAAKEKLKNLKLSGAFTDGDIVKKMAVAEKAAAAAKSLSTWTKVLSFLGKATGIVSWGASGYVFGASTYCTGQCLAE